MATFPDPTFYRGYASHQIQKVLKDVIKSEGFATIEAKNVERIQHCHKVAERTENFIDGICSEESPLQRKVSDMTKVDAKLSSGIVMLSGRTVGQLLKMVAEMVQSKHFLDIGTYSGYSAITVGESKYCESVTSLDNNEYCKEFVQDIIKGTPLEKKVEVLIGAAIESLQKLKEKGKTFDFVFIDADKSSYINYYKFILDNQLLNANGVILCDNILWSNDTTVDQITPQGRALYDFAHFVKKDVRVDQLVFPCRDGVMLIKLKSI